MQDDLVPKRHMKKAVRSVTMAPDRADLFGDAPPEDLLTPYKGIDGEKLIGVQKKYRDRRRNILRCWNRAQLYTPELLSLEALRSRVLELSTAHGAMLEIYRHFGHQVLGTDYANFPREGAEPNTRQRSVATKMPSSRIIANDPDVTWPYKKITEAIDLPMAVFDAGHAPYPLDDNSQDYVMTFQAMEHYCHPSDWDTLIAEFCRVATTAVVIMINPLHPHLAQVEGYGEAYDNARKMMRNWNRSGFRCTSVHIQWGQALGFKLTRN